MANNNWRNFGGKYKSDKLSHISVGTVVADEILLRQVNNGQLEVHGSLTVDLNTFIKGTTRFQSDALINSNLYFGSGLNEIITTNAFISGSASGIGINTAAPISPYSLDILATGQPNSFIARSDTSTNFNVIARNNNNYGVAVKTDNKGSSIGFYNTRDAVITNKPNTYITSAGNVLSISSNSIQFNSPATVVGLFNESIAIYDSSQNPYLPNVYQDATIKAGNALTLVSQDNSSTTFLHIVSPNKKGLAITGGGNFPMDGDRAYGSIGVIDASTIFIPNQTIVSGNNKLNYTSTLGVNTFSPKTETYVMDINGPLHIGNGEVSIVQNLGFDVSFMSFSKKNSAIGIVCGGASSATTPYYQTISYTKDSGKTWSQSVVDISATHALIKNSAETICISTYDASYAVIGGITKYSDIFYYTSDGGSTWNLLSDPNNTSSTYTATTVYLSSYCVTTNSYNDGNSKRLFIGGMLKSDSVYSIQIYCTDINKSKLDANIAPLSFINQLYLTGIKLSYVNHSDASYNAIYFVGNGIQKIWVDTLLTDTYWNIGTYQYNNVYVYDPKRVIAVGNNIITSICDGITCTNITTTSTGSSVGILRAVYMYDTSCAIAVGNEGTILYSNDTLKWQKIPTQILNSSGLGSVVTNPNYDLTGVHMPDINSINITQVVTKYDSLTNTHTGSSNILYGFYPNLFNYLNNTVLDVSGNMNISGNITITNNRQLNSNQINLSGDIIPIIGNLYDLGSKDFYFNTIYAKSQVLTNKTTYFTDADSDGAIIGSMSYSTDVSGLQFVAVSSLGNIVSNAVVSYGGNVALGYFNQTPPFTLDISGTVNINNTIRINNDVSINTHLFVGKDISLNSRLFINNDVSANSRVFIGQDVSLNSRLFVNNDVSANSRVFIGQDVSLNSRLFVNNDVSANSRVFIGQDVSLNSRLFVNNDVSANSRVFIGQDVSLNSRLFVNNDVSANSRVFIGQDVSLNSRLFVNNDVSANSRVFIGQDVSLNSRLFVNNDVSANSRVFIGQDVSLNSRLFINNDVSANSRVFIGQDVSLNSRLFVNNDVSANSRVFIGKDVSLNSRLFVNNDVSANSRVFIGQDMSLNSRLFINNDVSANSRVFIGQDVSLNSRLFVNNDISANSRLFIGGNSILNSNLLVIKDITGTGRLNITTDSSFGGNMTVTGMMNMLNTVTITGTTTLNGSAVFNGGVTTNGNSITTGNATIQGNIFTPYLDALTSGGNIYMGPTNAGNIYLGSFLNSTSSRKIYIGNTNDTVYLSGSVTTYTTQTLEVGSKTIVVNQDLSSVLVASSAGAGVSIHDNGTDTAGYIWVSNDMSGYVLKPPNPGSNIVKLDLNSMVLSSGINTGLMVLKSNTGDSNYRMTVQNIDTSNILIRSASLSTDAIQYVTSSVYVTNDISLGGRLYVSNSDITTKGSLFVSKDVSLNSRLFVSSDVTSNSRLFIGGDASLNSRLYVVNDISGSGRLNITGDVSLNGNLTVGVAMNIIGNVTTTGNIITQYMDAITSGANIYIGSVNALNINMGSFINPLTARTINIGNTKDTVIISGNVITKSAATLQIVSPNILINQGSNAYGSSAGAGILVRDNSNSNAGYIQVAVDMSGYLFCPPNQRSNVVKLSINSMVLASGINTGLIVLKKTSGTFTDSDASYSMTLQNIDVSNILIRNMALSTDTTQYISSNVSITNDLSLAGRLYINSDLSANQRVFVGQDVSLNSRLFVKSDISANSRLFVGGNTSLNGTLAVAGVTTMNNTLVANSDVYANNRIFVGNDVSVNGNVYVAQNLTLGGIVNFIGMSIGSNTAFPNTTLDISGNMEQLNGAIFQF